MVLFASPDRWKVLENGARRARVELTAGDDFLLLKIE